ncbi:MAG: hypothetical protein K2P88_03785 [Chitinophagaceae bacterium]|nr:hypothetical protein [Chitinophagaceae bacterium]
MKQLVLILSLVVLTTVSRSQTHILGRIKITEPLGFTKEATSNSVKFTKADISTKHWCVIGVQAEIIGTGNIETDFSNDWTELIAVPYHITKEAIPIEVPEKTGFNKKGGAGSFEFSGSSAMAVLYCFVSNNTKTSIIVLTNSDEFAPIIDSFINELTFLVTPPPENKSQIGLNGKPTSLVGKWIRSSGVNPVYGNPATWGAGGYTKSMYVFNADGTYSFFEQTFGYSVSNLILSKEFGTYKLEGNKLTITPKSGATESWSKKDNTDNWGKLLKTEKRILETVTYTQQFYYFSGIQEWNLALQTEKPTVRDGTFSYNKSLENAYYFSKESNTNKGIDLPKK